jgi:hypothetical protein
MKNVMLDLETLGTKPGSVILSLGAVFFDPIMGIGDTIYRVISTKSCVERGLTIDEATVKWWRDKTEEARKVLTLAESENSDDNVGLPYACMDFNRFLTRNDSGDNIAVWGNGSDFDNALLGVAYDKAEIAPAWKFYNNRCYRTLKNLHVGLKLKRVGTYHNALDDAISQAHHANEILNSLALISKVSY